MEQNTSATKPKKGLKRLWAKFKTSLRSGSSIPSTGDRQVVSSATPVVKSSTAELAQPDAATTTHIERPTTIQETLRQQPTQEGEAAPAQSALRNQTRIDSIELHTAFMADTIEVDDDETAVDDIVLPARYQRQGSVADKTRIEYAQALFEKYNFKFEPSDWPDQSASQVQRVEKKPRMRVRWTCHECKNTFGKAKICSQCEHQRCMECTRYPTKKVGEQPRRRTGKPDGEPTTVMAIPTFGACHECKVQFSMGDAECSNCNHQICERCLKETIMAAPVATPMAMAQ